MRLQDKRGFYYVNIGFWFIAFLLLIVQLFRWQIADAGGFKRLGSVYIEAEQKIQNERGDIFTADGITVATDRIFWRPFISIVHEEEYEKLKERWGVLREIFAQFDIKVSEDPIPFDEVSYYLFDKLLEETEKERLEAKLRENQIVGVYFKEEIRRLYPAGRFLSHVLGFVVKEDDQKYRGVYGIEGYFWPELSGRMGQIVHERDIKGRILSAADYRRYVMREGKNIVLTINSKIQRKVEEILEQKVKEYEALSGTVIVMDPKTGAILAMANYPNYDPNTYYKVDDYTIFKNKAVTDPYEYGSVQKPLTLAIALEEKVIDTDFKCFDSGVLEVLDKKIYNFRRKRYGWLGLADILYRSNNVCSATIALKLTPEIMYTYLRKLGIGTLLNIGLQEEETSYLKPPSKWNKVDLAVSAFGQMVSATPLQIISAHSTLANNGVRMQPFLIREIYDSEERVRFTPHAVERVFSEDTVRNVVSFMVSATMRRGLFKRYKGKIDIAGKTGTAQIPNPEGGGYLEDAVNTTFVGFAPAYDPRFIMLVKFERPKKYTTGSTTAAPTWVEIFEAIKDDLGIVY